MMRGALQIVLLLSQLIWIMVGCDQANFKAPVAFETGYIFPGAATMTENEDGTYVLTWPPPPAEDVLYRIFKRTGSEEYDFTKPFKQTEKQIYVTDNLRFSPQTCFVVRFYVDGYEGDQNTNEVCSKEFDFQFGGIEELTRDEKNIWTLSWKQSPFKRSSYQVFEVDPNGAVATSPLREVSETSTRVGPFPVGVLKCYVVRLLIGGSVDGDKNTQMKCTDSNMIGGFVGIERATSESTGMVVLNWTPAQNDAIRGYIIYRGNTFQEIVTKVDLRQSNFVIVDNLLPGSTQTFGVRALSEDGSEDQNMRTINVIVKDMRPLSFTGLTNASVAGKGEVLLTWEPVAGAAGYRVYMGTGLFDSNPPPDFSKPFVTISDLSKNELRIQNLGDESEYSFLLRAVSPFGIEDTNSSPKIVKIPDQGAPVFRGVKAATNLADGKVQLTWDPALGYVKRYKIFMAKGSGANVAQASNNFTQTNLPAEPGTSTSTIVGGFQANQFYTFTVRAEDEKNQDSNFVTVSILVGQQSLPQFMGYTSVSALGERSLRIGFNVTNDSNVLQYRVRARPTCTSPTNNCSWMTNDIVAQDTSKPILYFTIGGDDANSPLQPKREYEILVTAIDIWGNESNNTATYKISTLDLTPPIFFGISGVEQIAGTSFLKVSWQPRTTTDVDKYFIYWSTLPMDGSQLKSSASLPTGVMKSPIIDGAASFYTFSNLQRGQTYYFVVHALDSAGNEEANSSQMSMVVLNSFPSLVADTTLIRTPEREPGVVVNFTATDSNQSDDLLISMSSTTCPSEYSLPQLSVLPQAGGTRKAQVTWTPSQDFIRSGLLERTCTATFSVFDGEASSPVVLLTLTAYNRTPRDPAALIEPIVGGFKRNQTLTCSASAVDDDGNALVYDFQWVKNGSPLAGATSSTLSPTLAAYLPNDKVSCRVGVSDDHIRVVIDSSEVTMGNSAPTLRFLTIAEDGGVAPLYVSDRVVCTVEFIDTDGDTVTAGALGIESASDANGTGGWTSETLEAASCSIAKSTKTCFRVTPAMRRKFLRCKLDSFSDGYSPVLTASYSATAVEVKNSTPKINSVSISPNSAFEVDSVLNCNADISDIDEDALQIAPQFNWSRDGILIPNSSSSSYTVTTADRSTQLRCEALLQANADGFGSTLVGPVKSSARSYSNSVPQIQSVLITPSADARTGDTLTCSVSVRDPDGDFVSLEPPTGVYSWIANDGLSDVVLAGQSGNTLLISQDLRTKTLKCSFGLLANADQRGAPAIAPVASSNGVYVKNSNPVLTGVTITSGTVPVVTGTVLTCNKTVTDIDGDASNLLPVYVWYANGAVISGQAQQTYLTRASNRGKDISCSVFLPLNFDGQGSAPVGPVNASNSFRPINSEPVLSAVQVTSLSAEPYYPGMTLTCTIGSLSDPDGDSVAALFRWYSGAEQLAVETQDYTLTSADRGRNLKCAVELPQNADNMGSVAQLVYSFNSAFIENRAPVKNFQTLLQSAGAAVVHRFASVRCVIPSAVTQLDPDDDQVTVTYVWKKDGQLFPGTSAAGTLSDVLDLSTDPMSAPGQNITCQALLSDGLLTSASIASSSLSIQNRAPVVVGAPLTSISPTTLFAASRTGSDTVTCQASNFTDQDGDVISLDYYFFRRRKDDQGSATRMAIVEGGNSYTAPPVAQQNPNNAWLRDDNVWCAVVATDTYGGSATIGNTTGASGSILAQMQPTLVQNSTPEATSLMCNGGNQNLNLFAGTPLTTTACNNTFSDGDGDPVVYTHVPALSTCPNLGVSLFLDTANGVLSGLVPNVPCQITLAMKDSLDAQAYNVSTGQPVTTVITFAQPFIALFRRASMDNQCRVNFETSFTPASVSYGSSSVTLSTPAIAPVVHSNPSTESGIITATVNGGGAVQATWTVTGSVSSFVQTLQKTVTVSDSPAVPSVPSTVVPLPGVQITPQPDATGLRAEGCALADCVGRAGSIASALAHSCAVASDGRLFCWGENFRGELGLGNLLAAESSAPLEVGLPSAHRAKAVTASGSTALNAAHSCSHLEEDVGGQFQDRGIYCWGDNQYGQLGRGTVDSNAVLSQALPQGVVGLSGASAAGAVTTVVTGGGHTCALLAAAVPANGGGLRCWGANGKGQLGDGTLQSNPLPTSVIGFTSSGVLGMALGAQHTCIITNVNTVQCWGDNLYFQLGYQYDADLLKYRASPKTVPGLSDVVALAAGDFHTCAILKTTGDVKCWGLNSSGQLGSSTVAFSDQPQPPLGSVITTGERAVSITAAGNHTCALLESGSVKCWGANNMGQLGNNQTLNVNYPVDVLNLNNQGLAIEAGNSHTCILKNTGGVSCFGAFTALGLASSQKTPTNNAMPQVTLSPPVPAAQFRNCRVLRAYDQ